MYIILIVVLLKAVEFHSLNFFILHGKSSDSSYITNSLICYSSS